VEVECIEEMEVDSPSRAEAAMMQLLRMLHGGGGFISPTRLPQKNPNPPQHLNVRADLHAVHFSFSLPRT
jgi:hypothetical protein